MNKIDHNQLPELLLDIDKIARKAGEKILEISGAATGEASIELQLSKIAGISITFS